MSASITLYDEVIYWPLINLIIASTSYGTLSQNWNYYKELTILVGSICLGSYIAMQCIMYGLSHFVDVTAYSHISFWTPSQMLKTIRTAKNHSTYLLVYHFYIIYLEYGQHVAILLLNSIGSHRNWGSHRGYCVFEWSSVVILYAIMACNNQCEVSFGNPLVYSLNQIPVASAKWPHCGLASMDIASKQQVLEICFSSSHGCMHRSVWQLSLDIQDFQLILS